MATAPTQRQTEEAPSAPGELARGTVFGRYVILDQVGAGGMGAVFLAHDAALDRNVALKIVRHAAERSAQARLVQEAKAMARVQHRSIVTVHDVGAVGARVYVAMELVRGTTLRGWLDAEQRDVRAIVAMFVEAGRGLEAAHAAGVVHGDFKPENVLVDDAGHARVTDFGLAQLLAEDGTAIWAQSAGTPLYMAPEQHAKRPVDARTDQFSFCVSLWSAVYGAHPFGDDVAKLPALVARGELRAPGNGPRWLADALRTGLATEPSARHPSMTALLATLERGLAPRRRLALAAATATVLLGAGITAVAVRSTGPSCDGVADRVAAVWTAERRSAIEKAVVDPKLRAYVLGALDDHARTLGERRVEACRATHVRGDQSQALLDLRMACIDRRLAELSALADGLADPAVASSAFAAIERLVPPSACDDTATLAEVVPPPDDPRKRAEVAAIRDELARAKAEQDLGRFTRGLAIVEPLVPRARALDYAPVLAEAQLQHGSLAYRGGKLDVAEEALYAAVATADRGRAGDVAAQAWLELLWFVSQERGRLREAQRLGRLAEGAVARFAGNPALASALAERLGVIAYDLGDYDVATPYLQRAHDIRRQQLGDDHPYTAVSVQHLALLAAARGDHARALEQHRQVLAVFERVLGEDHPNTQVALANVGGALFDVENYEEAGTYFDRALAIATRTNQSPVDIAAAHTNVGLIRTIRGEHEVAIDHQRRALAMLEEVVAPDTPQLVRQYAEVARTLQRASRFDEAIAAYAHAAPRLERVAQPPELLRFYENYAAALDRRPK